jgi:hypothetical protein
MAIGIWLWHTLLSVLLEGGPLRRCWSSQNLTSRLARRWVIPVNPTGLAE